VWLLLLFGCLTGALIVPAARLYLVPTVAVMAAGLACHGLISWRPPGLRAWWTVTIGVCLLAIGYVISAADAGRWPDLRRTYPQPYDALFLVATFIVIVGAVLLLSRIHPSRDRGDLIDALIVAVGLGSVVVQRMVGGEQSSALPPIIAVTFPLASIVLLTAVVRVMLTGGVRNATSLLLTATVLAAVLSDIPRARQAATGYLAYDSILAAFSVVKMALFASAVMMPDVADPRLYAPARPTLGARSRLLTVSLLAFAGPVVLTVAWLLGWPVDPRLPMIATVVIIALSVVRIDGLLRSMEYRASHDALTGVLDRVTFHQSAVAVIARGDAGVCIGLLDVDEFKRLNDTYGHLAGDEVLRITASRLVGGLRAQDCVGRFGGDEFAIMLRADDPAVIARRLLDLLNAPFQIAEQELAVRISIGIARPAADRLDPDSAVEDALRRADAAMYEAKSAGAGFVLAPD
jgi:diguanylate cyclase